MEYSAYLDMAASEDRHWWFTGRRRVLEAVIGRLSLKPDAAILELGSGTGGNFQMLSRFGRITAIEMNEAARNISRGRLNGGDVYAGVLPAALPTLETFDLICLFDVLEHVEDDAATLSVVRSLLAPGGVAVITVPAYKALFGPHDVELHHKRRYEAAELRGKLMAAGLKVEKFSFMNAALMPVAWAARWLDKILKRRQASGTNIPAGPLNTLLAVVFGAEALVVPRMDLPFGLSLLAVVSAKS